MSKATAGTKGSKAAKAVATIVEGPTIQIRRVTRHRICVTVENIDGSPLLMNNGRQAEEVFAKRDAAQEAGKASAPREKLKTAQEMFEASKYQLEDGRYYLPATAFKIGMVEAAVGSDQSKKDVSKSKARGTIYVRGTDPDHPDKVFITGECDRFDAVGRVGSPTSKKACPRSRARFKNWKASLVIEHSERMRVEDVIHILNLAGDSEGVGDWRPGIKTSSGGEHGRYEVTGAAHYVSGGGK